MTILAARLRAVLLLNKYQQKRKKEDISPIVYSGLTAASNLILYFVVKKINNKINKNIITL